jgi:hypothetical protein
MTTTRIIVFGSVILFVIGSTTFGAFAATGFFTNISGLKPGDPGNSNLGTTSFKTNGDCAAIIAAIPNTPSTDKAFAEKGGYIRDYITQASDYFGIPAAFIAAVMENESAFNPVAGPSSAGALGLMQLMPGTYSDLNTTTIKTISKDLALSRGYTKADATMRQVYKSSFQSLGSKPVTMLGNLKPGTDILNTKYNIFLGATHLRRDYDLFKKDPRYQGDNIYKIILVAYNGGQDTAKKEGLQPTVKQTQNYVPAIMARYKIYAQCENKLTTPTTTTPAATSTHSQAIADKAKSLIGTKSTCYYADANIACASFVAAVVNPIAGTKLGAGAPTNLANGGGTAIQLADIQPGDVVYWNDSASHTGIYIGNYTGPTGYSDGNQTIPQAVVANGSSIEHIGVVPLGYAKIAGIRRY